MKGSSAPLALLLIDKGANAWTCVRGWAVDMIDKSTLEIHRDSETDGESGGGSDGGDGGVYADMAALAEGLPANQPRFVILSYPITLVRSCVYALCLRSQGLEF